MKKVSLMLLSLMFAIPVSTYAAGDAAAGDAAAGKSKSTLCAACHGAKGISANDMWPNLAGQKQGYLVKQIKAFKDGSRNDPMMSPMATPLSDDDIVNLAAYFSSLK